MRVIVRRERPHPGAQLSLLDDVDGWRYQPSPPTPPPASSAFLEARHRAHARVEDRIRAAKDTGLGRFPSREFTINQTWLQLVAIAADLTAWLRLLALSGDLATAEPKLLRFKMLHVPARLSRGGRRRQLRLPRHWPWADQILSGVPSDHDHPSTHLTRGHHPSAQPRNHRRPAPGASAGYSQRPHLENGKPHASRSTATPIRHHHERPGLAGRDQR